MPTCTACGSDEWKFNVGHTTSLTTKIRQHNGEELRCQRCNKKATLLMEAQIRQTDQFKEVQAQEETYKS